VSGRSSGDGISGGSGDSGARGSSTSPRLSLEQQGRLLYLYIRQRDRLIRMARGALPVEAADDAEDLIQAVFSEAVQRCARAPSFRPGEGWLVRRLRSRVIDRYRERYRDRRSGVLSLDDVESWAGHLVAADRVASPDEVAVARVTVEQLLATVADPQDRAALQLRVEGLREADIARLLHLSYRTRQVRDRLARARRQVAAELETSCRETDGVRRGRTVNGPAA